MKKILAALICSAATLGALAGASARAADFPTRPVTLIVPNAPGGAIDILARLLSERLQALWGQPVVVLYKPGANTVVGTEFVARSQPDGYTLGIAVTSHVINPSLRSSMPYDTVKDLSGVSLMVTSQIVISATPSFAPNTLAEVLDYARKNPGKLSYASPGSGSSMHLIGERIKKEAGIEALHVPFKGSGPAYPEVMAGRIQLLIDPLFSSMPYIKSGKLKAIAVTGARRDATAPNVPTVAETLPGFDVQSTFGMIVPSATPRDLVARISQDLAKIIKSPDFTKRLDEIGMTPVASTPAEYDQYIRREIDKWAPIVKASGATAD